MPVSLLAVVVAIAPVASLTDGEAGVQALERILATAVAAVPDRTVVPAAKVREALRSARRRDLASCEGDPTCLGELGRLVGASVVVSAETAALADGRVAYLKAVDAGSGLLVRSTVLVLGERPDDGAARAAAYRLLAPEAYLGRLDLVVDVSGAEVFLDGRLLGKTPLPPFPVDVGTHALRVSHPRTRDVVRFVEVKFAETATVKADLAAYAIVGDHLRPDGSDGRPIYQRPWFLVGAAVSVAVVTAVIVALIPRDIERDRDAVVGGHQR